MDSLPISLKPGARVSHADEDYVVLRATSFDLIWAQRISDGATKELPRTELQPPIQKANEEDAPPDSGTSTRRAGLSKRQVRSVFLNDRSSDASQAQVTAAMDEFRLLMEVLEERDRSVRKKLLEGIAQSYGYSLATAYSRLRKVAVDGSADALLHAVRSDKGKSRCSERAIQIMDQRLVLRLRPEPAAMDEVLGLVNGDLRSEGLKEISRSTLYARLANTSYRDQLLAAGRGEAVRNTYRAKIGHLPNADFPLAIVQVDHTPCQMCLVDSVTRQPLNDAWLTLVIDCYSRMVLGFYLSLDGPSTLTTGIALTNAFLPKDNFLRSIDVTGEWPCWGFPDLIHVDNAAELNGKMMQAARRRHRFVLRDRPLGQPNFGGHVESAFKTFMSVIKSLPGTKFSNPKERAEYDSEGNSAMTLDAFERLFTDFLINDYHLSEHSGEGMERRTPLQRWRDGILYGDVMPPTGLPDLPGDIDQIRISFMTLDRRTVRSGRLKFEHQTYYSKDLIALSNEVDLRKPLDERLFEFRYDPRDMSCIYVFDPGKNVYIKATNANHAHHGISVWELSARRKALGHPAEVFKETRYQSQKLRESIRASEKKITKKMRRETERRKRYDKELTTQPRPLGTAPTEKPNGVPARPMDAAALAEWRAAVIAAKKGHTTK
jgi:putative transposase